MNLKEALKVIQNKKNHTEKEICLAEKIIDIAIHLEKGLIKQK